MRYFSIVLFLMVTNGVYNESHAQTDKPDWRGMFYKAKTEKDFNQIVNLNAQQLNIQDSLELLAYQGVSKAATAQFAFLPTTKYSVFQDGIKLLERSIQKKKTFENVLLRVVVQVETPSFLGYTSNIKEDLSYLIAQLKIVDTSSILYQFQLKMITELDNDQVKELKIKMLEAV